MYPHLSLEDCSTWTGTAVVIDVLRAFSTAAYAFRAGAAEILLTDTIERAVALRARFPEALIVGEMHGRPVPEFDLLNSPTALSAANLTGRTIIQRTSSGTQGVVRSANAGRIYATSFCCAAATARALRPHRDDVAFVVTAGEDDTACADYIGALLSDARPHFDEFAERVRSSDHGRDFQMDDADFPLSDLDACLALDLVSFAMRVTRRDDLLVMTPEYPDQR